VKGKFSRYRTDGVAPQWFPFIRPAIRSERDTDVKKTTHIRMRRAGAIGLGIAIATCGLAAAPAFATGNDTDGYVGIAGADAYSTNYESVIRADLDGATDYTTQTAPGGYGRFAFATVADGAYTLSLTSIDPDHPTQPWSEPVIADDGNIYLDEDHDATYDGDESYLNDEDIYLTALPDIPAPGTASLAGDPIEGGTVTGSTSGWPIGTTLTYQWGYGRGQSGDDITGATSTTLVVPEEAIGGTLGFIVTGHLTGYTPTSVGAHADKVAYTTQKPAVAAPVANSDGLAAYLMQHDVDTAASSTVGLPASLDSSKQYTANLGWYWADSFVDVYAYSTPTFIGSFAVVNGVAQINLSASQLAALGGGNHTLVAIGQSSNGVQSVALSISAVLASTGFDPMMPIGTAAVLLLLGASLMLVRRSQVTRSTK
jgi:hypothetical protein